VTLNDAPGWINPELNMPPSAVQVCAIESRLVTVTTVSGDTDSTDGLKAGSPPRIFIVIAAWDITVVVVGGVVVVVGGTVGGADAVVPVGPC
jgi:hypothetical protein